MTKSYIRKGGQFRKVLTGITVDDTFVLPAGCMIDSIYTKKVDTSTTVLAIGSAKTEKEKSIFTFENYTVGVAGTLTFTPSSQQAVTINLSATDVLSVNAIASKVVSVLNATPAVTAVYTIELHGLDSVKVEAKLEVDLTAATLALGNAQGFTIASAASDFYCVQDVLAPVTLSAAGFAKQTVALGLFSSSEDQTIYFSLSNADSIIDLYVLMSMYN